MKTNNVSFSFVNRIGTRKLEGDELHGLKSILARSAGLSRYVCPCTAEELKEFINDSYGRTEPFNPRNLPTQESPSEGAA
jgi:hypothetical protein